MLWLEAPGALLGLAACSCLERYFGNHQILQLWERLRPSLQVSAPTLCSG